METHPQVGICGAYIQSFNEKGDLDIRKYATGDASLRKNIFKFSPVAQPVAIVRKEAIEKVGKFNPKYPPAEDIDLSFRMGEHYEFGNVPEVLLKYREHQTSATHKKLKKQIDATLEVRRLYIKNPKYRFNLADYPAYLATKIMAYFPPSITLPLFKFARNVFIRR